MFVVWVSFLKHELLKWIIARRRPLPADGPGVRLLPRQRHLPRLAATATTTTTTTSTTTNNNNDNDDDNNDDNDNDNDNSTHDMINRLSEFGADLSNESEMVWFTMACDYLERKSIDFAYWP